jgi:hypothetical protein
MPHSPTTRLNTGAYVPPRKPMMWGVRHRHFIATIICILGLLITLFKVHSTPQPITTMGITTHSLITKDKSTSRATAVTAATPKKR